MSRDNSSDNDHHGSLSEKGSFKRSHSTSKTESETTPSIEVVRRNSLAALSVAAEPYQVGEPKWPSGWRPYTCLFGGFLLMFNSWGLVSVPHLLELEIRD